MTTKPKRRRRTQAEIATARRRAEATRKRNLKQRHSMTVEQYDELLDFQGGLCPICLRARGKSRALAVEHDHNKAREGCEHPHQQSCEKCWRGLCCQRCNDMLAHALDDPQFFYRAIEYLKRPPAPRWMMAKDE